MDNQCNYIMQESENLIIRIKEAFQDAEFPSHLGLHAAVAMDIWVQDPLELEKITQEEDYFGDWWDVPDEHLEECGSLACSYLDAIGIYYYLPAFMVKALRDKKTSSLIPVKACLDPRPYRDEEELYSHFCDHFKLFDFKHEQLCMEFIQLIDVIHPELPRVSREHKFIGILDDDFWKR